jgi:hypothetical protein
MLDAIEVYAKDLREALETNEREFAEVRAKVQDGCSYGDLFDALAAMHEIKDRFAKAERKLLAAFLRDYARRTGVEVPEHALAPTLK